MMLRSSTFPLALALLVGATGPTRAKPAPPARLSSFDQVAARLGDARFRILDARPRAEYDRGHLPGSVPVDVKAAQAIASKPGGLADREAWLTWIEPLGIKPGMIVRIVDGDRQLEAARVWWLLSYLGVEDVGLVDGNVGLWAEGGRPMATDPTRVQPAPFPIRFRTDRLATRADVSNAVRDRSAAIVDARSLLEFTGETKMSKRGGHVPDACRLEWSDLVDARGRFLAPEAVQARARDLGIEAGRPIIAHCQGGGRASVDTFAFERAGFPARNFYAGWSDWGNAEDTPVVEGPPPAKP